MPDEKQKTQAEKTAPAEPGADTVECDRCRYAFDPAELCDDGLCEDCRCDLSGGEYMSDHNERMHERASMGLDN